MGKKRRNKLGITIAGIGLLFFLYPSAETIDSKKPKEEISDSTRVARFKPSVTETTDLSNFLEHEISYYYDIPFETVWEGYTKFNPKDVWDGPINYLNLVYSESEKFADQKIKPGIIFLIDLKLFKKIEMTALFKVTTINYENGIIEFCYSKDNISQGIQRLIFIKEKEGTQITHKTWYKSSHGFRDKLYPIYHTKCLAEFHANVHNHILDLQLSKDSLIIQ
jgi:hypothetical protein